MSEVVRLTIDERSVEVPAGSTVLDAARAVGIDIPTLCHADDFEPPASCMVCLVRINGQDRMSPACATKVATGMIVESESEAVRAARKASLELLLSEHVGDCVAPCHRTCPSGIDIPGMLRHIEDGEFEAAVAVVRRETALPGVLGYICTAPCESACRRAAIDASPSICSLHRFITELDLALDHPHTPPRAEATGKRVAVVGAGPAGLSAAWHLHLAGHEVTVFDRHPEAGGSLRRATDPIDLPPSILDGEIGLMTRVGIRFELGQAIGASGPSVAQLRAAHDAVLIAAGQSADEQRVALGLGADGPMGDRQTHRTEAPGVFIAGAAVRGKAIAARILGDGKAAAAAIDAHLLGGSRTEADPSDRGGWSVRSGRLSADELAQLTVGIDHYDDLHETTAAEHARAEAAMCLHCDCSGARSCKLRQYAAEYGAEPRRFDAERPAMEVVREHPDVTYEPGKCIRCGLCVKVAREMGEPVGITFVGRGYSVRVAAPMGKTLAEALTHAAQAVAERCPTGALTWEPARRRQIEPQPASRDELV